MDLYCPGCGYFTSSERSHSPSCPSCGSPVEPIDLDPIQEELDRLSAKVSAAGLMSRKEAKRSLINALRGLTNGKE